MGDASQLAFVSRHRGRLAPPVLEAGSRDWEGTSPDYRSLFAPGEYVGVDAAAGSGVDLAIDLTAPFAVVDAALGGRRFATILCMSMLEHCRDPFRAAANLTRLLLPGGIVVVSVPFVWTPHGYPNDYWRFTPDGVRALFPELSFDDADGASSTGRETTPLRLLDERLRRIELSISTGLREGDYGLLRSLALRAARLLRLYPAAFDERYLYPPVMIHLLGVSAAA